MYTIPVNAGIIHVSSVVSTSSHLASMEQVIAAVDEIKSEMQAMNSAMETKMHAMHESMELLLQHKHGWQAHMVSAWQPAEDGRP